jgi:hypothetical protein
MASEGSIEDKSRVVARVASKLFSIAIPESNVIVETLDRVTDAMQDRNLRTSLGAAIDAGLRQNVTDADLRVHPLAVWVETRLGVSPRGDATWNDSSGFVWLVRPVRGPGI